MSRFTKLASAFVIVASIFSAAPVVQADDHLHSPVLNHVQHDYRQFDLFLGSCPHSLEHYGVYTSLDAVQAVAREFQKQGYYVSIRLRY